MATIILQLDTTQLSNPDLDLRYVLPDLITQQSAGRLKDDGYDYVGEGLDHLMLLFFTTEDAPAQIPGLIAFLTSERVMGNDLANVVVGVEDGAERRIVHPPGFDGPFHWPA